MVSSFKEKSVLLIITGLAIAMLLLSGMPATALASSMRVIAAMSPKQTTSSFAKAHKVTTDGSGYIPSDFPNRKNYQVNPQYKQSNDNDSNNSSYWGSDQDNSGNRGYNWGLNLDNVSNTGNQVNNPKGTFRNQVNPQYKQSNDNDSNNSSYWGSDQDNSGNRGYNWGLNQDNYSNYGNQVNN
jgi:hypothetical protein